MSQITAHSNDPADPDNPNPSGQWDMLAVDDLFYIIRNDTVPPLFMKSDDLHEGTSYEIDVLPSIMRGGEHYFGVNKKRYRLLGNVLRIVHDLSDESDIFLDRPIADASLGGDHYCARLKSNQNHYYKITVSKRQLEDKTFEYTYGYKVYEGIDAFLKGNNTGSKKNCDPVSWEAKAFWANGDYFYCLAEDGESVVRRKATKIEDLFTAPTINDTYTDKSTGMNSKVVTFIPGGFISDSFIQGDWVQSAMYIGGGTYDDEVQVQVGTNTEAVTNLAAHWEVADTASAKISSSGVLAAVGTAEVSNSVTTTYGIALSATFSKSASELSTVTQRFKGPQSSDEPDDYYWTFVLKQSGTDVLSTGLAKAITHTPAPPGNPWIKSTS